MYKVKNTLLEAIQRPKKVDGKIKTSISKQKIMREQERAGGRARESEKGRDVQNQFFPL